MNHSFSSQAEPEGKNQRGKKQETPPYLLVEGRYEGGDRGKKKKGKRDITFGKTNSAGKSCCRSGKGFV